MKKDILLFTIITIMLVVPYSCISPNKNDEIDTRWQELVQDVNKIQEQIPQKIEEGMTLIKAEYTDSIYSTWIKIGEKNTSLEEMSRLLAKRRREILDDISVSDGHDRYCYEKYVEYNVRMRLIYCDKTSDKQIELTITPSEIDEALHSEADAYQRLRMHINRTKYVHSENTDGMSMPVVTLKDSTVYMDFTLDEDLYEINSMNNEEKGTFKKEIMAEMRALSPKLIRFMADANCSFCYRIIGSNTKKRIVVEVSPNEIYINKVILDADDKIKSEIEKSDE